MPTIALFGNADGVTPADPASTKQDRFTGPYAERFLDVVGHNVPQEAPEAFAQAVLDVQASLP